MNGRGRPQKPSRAELTRQRFERRVNQHHLDRIADEKAKVVRLYSHVRSLEGLEESDTLSDAQLASQFDVPMKYVPIIRFALDDTLRPTGRSRRIWEEWQELQANE
jgi:hypothetical protein